MLKQAALCVLMLGCLWAAFFVSPWFWLGVGVSAAVLGETETGGMNIFRWNSPAYGRILKNRYPKQIDQYEHRLYGLSFWQLFIGVLVITHQKGTPKQEQPNVQD